MNLELHKIIVKHYCNTFLAKQFKIKEIINIFVNKSVSLNISFLKYLKLFAKIPNAY